MEEHRKPLLSITKILTLSRQDFSKLFTSTLLYGWPLWIFCIVSYYFFGSKFFPFLVKHLLFFDNLTVGNTFHIRTLLLALVITFVGPYLLLHHYLIAPLVIRIHYFFFKERITGSCNFYYSSGFNQQILARLIGKETWIYEFYKSGEFIPACMVLGTPIMMVFSDIFLGVDILAYSHAEMGLVNTLQSLESSSGIWAHRLLYSVPMLVCYLALIPRTKDKLNKIAKKLCYRPLLIANDAIPLLTTENYTAQLNEEQMREMRGLALISYLLCLTNLFFVIFVFCWSSQRVILFSLNSSWEALFYGSIIYCSLVATIVLVGAIEVNCCMTLKSLLHPVPSQQSPATLPNPSA